MYLPRNLIAHLYNNLIKRTHAAAPPVLLLVALEPDALCACRILTALLKRDYIPHKIQPIAGYGDLSRAAEDLVRPMRTTDGGSGGVVVCLGVGGMVDLEEILGLDVDENGQGGTGDVEVWVLDARRPWNLANVFGTPIGEDPVTGELVRRQSGVEKGKILQSYQTSRGGIIVFDDGDIEEELQAERTAYCALEEMPEVGEEDDSDGDSDGQDDEPSSAQLPKKRKSWSEADDSADDMTSGHGKGGGAIRYVWTNEKPRAHLTTTGRLNTVITGPKTSAKRLDDREPTRWVLRLLTLRLPQPLSLPGNSSATGEVCQEPPETAHGDAEQAHQRPRQVLPTRRLVRGTRLLPCLYPRL
jgi:hypothetical protein